MEKQSAAVTQPPIPGNWPGAFGIYKQSKQAVMINLWPLIFMGLFSLAVDLFLELLLPNKFPYEVINQVISFAVGSLTAVGSIFLYLAGIKGHRLNFKGALQKSYPYTLRMMALTLLLLLIAVGSLILLIIPFFIIMPRIALAIYFLVDKNIGVIDAIKASWTHTKGHAGKVWGIFGVSLLMSLLLLTIIGIPVAIYLLIMYGAAFALLYVYLIKHSSQQ